MKIKFANLDEYSLLPLGYGIYPSEAQFSINANDLLLADFEQTVMSAANCAKIEVIDEEHDNEVIAVVTGLPVISKLEKEFHVPFTEYEEEEYEDTEIVMVIDPETGEPVIDPETGEPETEEITVIKHRSVPVEVFYDVIRFNLKKAELEQTVEKNTADIEYIAIMSDIELE